MKIYLDTNIYFRTTDDQSQPRIHLEAQAILTIFSAIEEGILKLITSDILEFEISRCDKREADDITKSSFKLSSIHINHSNTIVNQSENLVKKLNILPADAMHLAVAKVAKSDFFITCDDLLIKKANLLSKEFSFSVVNPINFILTYPSYH